MGWDLHSYHVQENPLQTEIEFLRERVRLLERHLKEKEDNILELLAALGIKKDKVNLIPRYPVIYGPESKL